MIESKRTYAHTQAHAQKQRHTHRHTPKLGFQAWQTKVCRDSRQGSSCASSRRNRDSLVPLRHSPSRDGLVATSNASLRNDSLIVPSLAFRSILSPGRMSHSSGSCWCCRCCAFLSVPTLRGTCDEGKKEKQLAILQPSRLLCRLVDISNVFKHQKEI